MHFYGCVNHSSEKLFKRIRQEKEKALAAGHLDNRQTEEKFRNFFRCGSEDHLIELFSKPPKENDKYQKKLYVNEKGNIAYDNGNNNSDHKIYVSMAHMYGNNQCPRRSFREILQLNYWILDYGEMCHMTPEVSYFIPGLLEYTDKHIEFADGHHVTTKKRISTNKNVQKSWRSFHCNIAQCTFGTRYMQQVIFNHYSNEFGTDFFIPKMVLYCVLRSKR